MSLYKRGSSPIWWAQINVAGRRVQRSTHTKNRREAMKSHDRWKQELRLEVLHGVLPIYRWEDAVVRWMQESTHKKSLATDQEYFVWLHESLAGMPLNEIDWHTGEVIIERGLALGNQNSTINRRLSLVKTVLRKAQQQWKWIDQAPTFRKLKEPKKRVRYLMWEEFSRLLKELPQHLQVMAVIAVTTGLRQGNVKNLLWTQVDLERAELRFAGDDVKNGKAATIPLDPVAVACLRGQEGSHPTHVFHYMGKPVKQVAGKAWRAALKRAGITDFRWHDLRHCWATRHVQNGTPLDVLKELGLWSNIDMVHRYAHLAPSQIRAHVERIGELSLPLMEFIPSTIPKSQ